MHHVRATHRGAAGAEAVSPWPPLPSGTRNETQYALHRWTQILGKIRGTSTPLVNHTWNSSLQVTARGLTTGLIPGGGDAFQIDLDLVADELNVATSGGGRAVVALRAMSVADFYRDVLDALARVGVPDPHIAAVPNEVDPAIPFRKDVAGRPYDRDFVRRFATALVRTQLVFERFRAGFLGKASPVQFFWGAFDLASARFSGRRSPAYTGGVPPHVHPHVMHEAYSHELIAAGFWLGPADAPHAEYYAYAMPALARLSRARVEPDAAAWDDARGEFLLPYEVVRTSADPDAALLSFLESTYAAAADLGNWDRDLLEKSVVCDCESIPRPLRRSPRATVPGGER
jgi:hypothetical protein